MRNFMPVRQDETLIARGKYTYLTVISCFRTKICGEAASTEILFQLNHLTLQGSLY